MTEHSSEESADARMKEFEASANNDAEYWFRRCVQREKEIKQLRATIQRLRSALEPFAECGPFANHDDTPADPEGYFGYRRLQFKHFDEARAAYEGSPDAG